MNAPKKIFVWDYAADQMVNENPDSTDVAYIREDVVLELVEALKYCKQKIEYMHLPSELYSRGWAIDTANAALAKLEDV